MTSTLQQIVDEQLSKPVHAAIAAMSDAVRARHADAAAILAYGSALRDSSPEDTLIDLYVLTTSFAGVSSNASARFGCRLVPPNVYYGECQHGGKTFRAKYAVLPLHQFEARVSAQTGNPYFWARFCQPCRLVWTADDASRSRASKAIQCSLATAFGNAIALYPVGKVAEKWVSLFRNTYRTELRPESGNRADLIVAANQPFYEAAASALVATPPISASWAFRRFTGKALSVLRLVKAAFTFQGGADYIAWKIKRHSGVEIGVTDWMRRHPLLAAIRLLPGLLRRGAFK